MGFLLKHVQSSSALWFWVNDKSEKSAPLIYNFVQEMISQEQKKKVNSPRLDFHQVKSGIFSNGLNRVRKEASVWSMHCLSGESCVPNSGTFDVYQILVHSMIYL